MAQWTVQSGTWNGSGGTLTTSSANARIQLDTAHPDSVANHYVEVDITFASRGDRAGIMLSGNLFCEMEWLQECDYPSQYAASGAYCGVLRIWEGSTLLAILRHVEITSASVTLKAGYIRAESKVWLQFGSYCLRATTNTPTSYYVGLGTGSEVDSTVTFDDFYFYKGKTATNDCEDACTASTDSLPCVIAQAPAVPNKSSLTSDDICCDWTIAAGTWGGNTYTDGGNTYSYFYTTSSNARLDCNTEQRGVTEFGHMKVTQYAYSTAANSVVRIYLDYASTASCHMAEFTFGSAVTGNGGRIRLYKNGTEIADEPYSIPAGEWVTLSACLVPDSVNTVFDLFFADVNGQATDDGTYGEGVLAATNVNGNKKWSIGTGSNSGYVNLRGAVLYHSKTLDDDTECTPCHTEYECEPCPGGDGPDTGFVFEISGFETKYNGTCNCEANFDNTYVIPGACSGTLTTGTLCTDGGFEYYMILEWEITEATEHYWFLHLYIKIMRVQEGDDYQTYRVDYIQEFDDYTLCRSLDDEALSTDTVYGYDTDSPCENVEYLTITATSY